MDTNRRTILRMIAAGPVAAGFAWTDAEAQEAHQHAEAAQAAAKQAGTPFKPKFFTPHEYATVRLLVDIIIPKDERSGSATDAGVPEFMDFIIGDMGDMGDEPGRQLAMRGGLAWLDRECEGRFDKTFVACTAAERTQVLDAIAWPENAAPDHSHGVAFFNSFRDLTASGFWTSKMGIKDLEYIGNVYVPEWKGCPDDALKKLGL
jgi:gluconate 2-dehydrogenase gamma chain